MPGSTSLPPIVLGIIVLVMGLVMLGPIIKLFVQANVAGAPVPFTALLGMWLRRIDARAGELPPGDALLVLNAAARV